MKRWIAFLRAVNVGGRVVSMQELRGHFQALGFSDVETFIASGNVIFGSPQQDGSALERQIEEGLHASLGYEVPTFLRTEGELASIAVYRPFDEERVKSAMSNNVGFLARPPADAAKDALMAFRTEFDDFQLHGRELYWISTRKQSESKITNAMIEKVIGGRVTFRGVNTIARMAAKYLRSD